MNSPIRLLITTVCVAFTVFPQISFTSESNHPRIEVECWEVDLTEISEDLALEWMNNKGVVGVFTRSQYKTLERMLGSESIRSIGKASFTSGMSAAFQTSEAQGFEIRTSVMGTSPTTIELAFIEARPKTILGHQLQDKETSVLVWDDYFVAYRPARSQGKVRFITAKLVAPK